MPYCFVPSCRSGNPKYTKQLKADGKDIPRFFTAQNQEVLQIWSMKIKRGDKQLTMSDRVCSNHFLANDVESFFETRLADGTINRIPRDRAKLKDGAVPCVFEGYPSYYSILPKKRKDPMVRELNPAKKGRITKSAIEKEATDIHLDEEANPSDGTDIPFQAEEVTTQNPNEGVVMEPSATFVQAPDVDMRWSCTKVELLELPAGWTTCNTPQIREKVLVHINDNIQIDKSIEFQVETDIEVKIKGINYKSDLTFQIETVEDAQNLLKHIDKLRICRGTEKNSKPYSIFCSGATKSPREVRCHACSNERARLRKREQRLQKVQARAQEKRKKILSRLKHVTKSKTRLILKVQALKAKIGEAMLRCEAVKKETLVEAISQLPDAQQEAVKACFEAAKKKGATGRRYTLEWVYECLLMRIKSPKLYYHIRSHNILPLPAPSTLSSYTRNMGGTFGMQPITFEMLKKKSADMEEVKKHGIIMLDEMKLTPGITFDRANLSVEGILQLGEESLQEDKMKSLGDHALVITFQPFQGKWVQAIAAFLTRGNATADTLAHLVLEVVLSLERSGLKVDGVVTDGAQWNRTMWKKFGVDVDDPSCEHPYESERRLWFLSDFPHLMKCMRNCFIKKKLIQTPEGDVNLDHWKAILDQDALKKGGLKECPRLTPDHLHPDPWQKMNVAMAWQFWSGSAAAGMESYRMQGVQKLQDSDSSVKFTKRVNSMADVMNTNTPLNALRMNSHESRTIEDFLTYFKTLKAFANAELKKKSEIAAAAQAAFDEKNPLHKASKKRQPSKSCNKENHIFSESTDTGLLVTLTATLGLLKYLTEKCGFQYLMTARLNQDALERFFGLVRQSCGPNTHPEPKVFGQLFRLLSLYSLVKPVRGSNITGGEMLKSLFNMNDFRSKTSDERKDDLTRRLDEIISNGCDLEVIPELMHEIDHTYLDESVDTFALNYVGGFTARHCERFCKACQECQDCLKKPESDRSKNDTLITLKTKNWLTYPSDKLMQLLRTLEDQILRTYGRNEPQHNFLFLVLDRLEGVAVTQIGCEIHRSELTKAIIKFYLIMRMHFLCRQWNKEALLQKKKKQKGLRKQAHLV